MAWTDYFPHLCVDELAAGLLRDHHFESFVTFEYLDEGDAFFTLRCDSTREDTPGDANTNAEYGIVARLYGSSMRAMGFG